MGTVIQISHEDRVYEILVQQARTTDGQQEGENLSGPLPSGNSIGKLDISINSTTSSIIRCALGKC